MREIINVIVGIFNNEIEQIEEYLADDINVILERIGEISKKNEIIFVRKWC